MQSDEEALNHEQHEQARTLVTWYAEINLKAVLDQVTGIRQSVSQYCRFMMDESNSRERVSRLRTLTELQAKHWAEGVRVMLEQFDFQGVSIDPELRLAAIGLVNTVERMKLD